MLMEHRRRQGMRRAAGDAWAGCMPSIRKGIGRNALRLRRAPDEQIIGPPAFPVNAILGIDL
jgi:hypothetical protein